MAVPVRPPPPRHGFKQIGLKSHLTGPPYKHFYPGGQGEIDVRKTEIGEDSAQAARWRPGHGF